MTDLAIIGGTGLATLKNLEVTWRQVVHTPFGEPSCPLTYGHLCGKEVVFLPRHGSGHTIPPHKINYRANLWALKKTGATRVIAVAAVGSISTELVVSELALPDQIIDYTWGRGHTFFEEDLRGVVHVDFTYPYCSKLRSLLLKAAAAAGLSMADWVTYGATQGPRLETAAEIDRLERDGCHVVGMTGMPEAALARELELSYAAIAVIANQAAGRSENLIEMASVEQNLNRGMEKVRRLLEQLIPLA
ncbi:methylthioadenosine phosphorylase [Nitrosococcus oceani ATCC 19707]|uniref:Probable S-methyl-5'-thioinosine phosphorylase n=2 Tax=Nitrosococcus oceani TaxID=1229 RepID=Q3JDW6_NITOC|nr:S-methyl-5'-thioinosine phosphorylase [Nitrosococcus oceani]ABA56980.1 methylthioadenosine phosphorylase [Nitrosococcus oceani ATCC 19707]EDZ65447.1 methylthioadenosine phosphorylase [Nitrosococcus oceani AFC27]KFI20556.1 5'-methylthioadenosine phosphorylase [Nitrosococcus oceani C-27]GEM20905.1 5'-methylthioadenosine phosphorylase [Nitrosococcus oceani]